MLRLRISSLLILNILKFIISSDNNLLFVEEFSEDVLASGKWIKSIKEKYLDQPIVVTATNSSGSEYLDNMGFELLQPHRFYAVSSKFDKPIDTKGKDLVLQYETKFPDGGLECGGAYLKLPRYTDSLDLSLLDNDTPYTIMFGPDRCGDVDKVHFILQHQNPLTKKWEEKHLVSPPTVENNVRTHLYTLHIAQNNTIQIFIDMKLVKEANLFTDLTPAINPEKELDDPTDFKPADWVDEAKMKDPNAVKPDDWDESQPAMIVDDKDVMPADWLVNESLQIPDPTAVKPADWDDEDDGEWEAPPMDNPKCEAGNCGPYTPRKIPNPAYKGKWKAPMIDNPAYKGPWAPRKIPNKDYFFDSQPSDIAPIGAVAIEVWTVTGNIRFDNIILTHDLKSAFRFAKDTYVIRNEFENRNIKMKDDVLGSGNTAETDSVYKKFMAEADGYMRNVIIICVICTVFGISYFYVTWNVDKSFAKGKEKLVTLNDLTGTKKAEDKIDTPDATAAPTEDKTTSTVEASAEEDEEDTQEMSSTVRRRTRKE